MMLVTFLETKLVTTAVGKFQNWIQSTMRIKIIDTFSSQLTISRNSQKRLTKKNIEVTFDKTVK